MKPSEITALALYSGGLDSTLACRVVAAQGIRVIAVKFVTPFFGADLLARRDEHVWEVKDKYGIDLRLVDVAGEFLLMLRNPAHGYGRNFNPCIDCKIFLLTRAREMMREFAASFLITGEVIGQRPMSQRRDTLRVIERDSGCEDILVRPLCAKNLAPTRPERDGLIDREQLLAFNGRGRKPQMQLAEKFGITDYPSPAGGCILTDQNLGPRIEKFYNEQQDIAARDILLLLNGRQFKLPGGSWLAMGRDEDENEKIFKLLQPGDWILEAGDLPGPTALVRSLAGADDLQFAAGLVARYVKRNGNLPEYVGIVADNGAETIHMTVSPLDDLISRPWKR